MITFEDHRELLFGYSAWYKALTEPEEDVSSAWHVAKNPLGDWPVQLLAAAAAFAIDHDVLSIYRERFAAIPGASLGLERARAKHRTVSGPIWEIANELIVGRYLERVFGWQYETHEPLGNAGRRGEWQMCAPSGRLVFVEVKTLNEREITVDASYHKPDYRERIQTVLHKRAYPQLPTDDRSTLVVLAGNGEALRTTHGVVHGDLFAAMFGRVGIHFSLEGPQATNFRMAPSLREMFVTPAKHRRMGCVAGLEIKGCAFPRLDFYAIHNPFALPAQRLDPADLADATQYAFREDGSNGLRQGLQPIVAWRRMATYAVPEDAEE